MIIPFWPEAIIMLFLSKKDLSPSPRLPMFIWKISTWLPTSRSQKLLATCQLGFSYEHVEISMKKRVAKQDFCNLASPVDLAHMKIRPWENFSMQLMWHTHAPKSSTAHQTIISCMSHKHLTQLQPSLQNIT